MATVNIDDELGRRARQAAAAEGKTLDEFVQEAVQVALDSATVQRGTRNGLPIMIMPAGTSAIDPRLVREMIEEQGF